MNAAQPCRRISEWNNIIFSTAEFIVQSQGMKSTQIIPCLSHSIKWIIYLVQIICLIILVVSKAIFWFGYDMGHPSLSSCHNISFPSSELCVRNVKALEDVCSYAPRWVSWAPNVKTCSNDWWQFRAAQSMKLQLTLLWSNIQNCHPPKVVVHFKLHRAWSSIHHTDPSSNHTIIYGVIVSSYSVQIWWWIFLHYISSIQKTN